MGLVFKVFNDLGYGHKENFYQKALAKEFRNNNIDYKEQLRCKVRYKGEDIGYYVIDFLISDKIVLEIKQKDFVSHKDIKQTYKYLQATKMKLGLIVTFTSRGVRYKRVLNLE